MAGRAKTFQTDQRRNSTASVLRGEGEGQGVFRVERSPEQPGYQ